MNRSFPTLLGTFVLGVLTLTAGLTAPAAGSDSFVVETIDAGDGVAGEHCAAARDSWSLVYLCYLDRTAGSLRFAKKDPVPVCSPPYGWDYETVDPEYKAKVPLRKVWVPAE